MAQGKIKIKAKLPANVKHKSLNKTKQNSAFQKRKNAPAKQKLKDKQKIQEAITKSVNRKNEEELKQRAFASSQPQNLSQAQKCVADYHDKAKAGTSSASMSTE